MSSDKHVSMIFYRGAVFFIGPVKLKIPVRTTWKALDFLSESHPRYMGRPGAVCQQGANFAQQNSDWNSLSRCLCCHRINDPDDMIL
jgi:hypothetical protein